MQFKTGLMLLLASSCAVGISYATFNRVRVMGDTTSSTDLTKLPLGDKKYTTSPKVGYIYTCQTSFNGGGAYKQGPWIDATNKTWDLTKKVTVDGSVKWSNAYLKVTVNGSTRTLSGDGLPINHNTGKFPIATTDDAYSYDHNPNSIKTQTISVSLPANPTLLSTPQCIGGEVGIMLSGVPIFDGFDAGGRDAVATEIQDECGGHPQESGQYHYHGYSKCLKDEVKADGHSGLIGYAYDGFGIYGLKGQNGTELSSNDLDVCHGHTHTITWDGKQVNMYHYHMTQDFPYSVSCFRGKANVKGVSNQSGGSRTGMGNTESRSTTTDRQNNERRLRLPTLDLGTMFGVR